MDRMVARTGGGGDAVRPGMVSVLANLSTHEAYVDRGLAARSFGAQVIDIDGQDSGVHRGGGDAARPGNGQRPR